MAKIKNPNNSGIISYDTNEKKVYGHAIGSQYLYVRAKRNGYTETIKKIRVNVLKGVRPGGPGGNGTGGNGFVIAKPDLFDIILGEPKNISITTDCAKLIVKFEPEDIATARIIDNYNIEFNGLKEGSFKAVILGYNIEGTLLGAAPIEGTVKNKGSIVVPIDPGPIDPGDDETPDDSEQPVDPGIDGGEVIIPGGDDEGGSEDLITPDAPPEEPEEDPIDDTVYEIDVDKPNLTFFVGEEDTVTITTTKNVDFEIFNRGNETYNTLEKTAFNKLKITSIGEGENIISLTVNDATGNIANIKDIVILNKKREEATTFNATATSYTVKPTNRLTIDFVSNITNPDEYTAEILPKLPDEFGKRNPVTTLGNVTRNLNNMIIDVPYIDNGGEYVVKVIAKKTDTVGTRYSSIEKEIPFNISTLPVALDKIIRTPYNIEKSNNNTVNIIETVPVTYKVERSDRGVMYPYNPTKISFWVHSSIDTSKLTIEVLDKGPGEKGSPSNIVINPTPEPTITDPKIKEHYISGMKKVTFDVLQSETVGGPVSTNSEHRYTYKIKATYDGIKYEKNMEIKPFAGSNIRAVTPDVTMPEFSKATIGLEGATVPPGQPEPLIKLHSDLGDIWDIEIEDTEGDVLGLFSDDTSGLGTNPYLHSNFSGRARVKFKTVVNGYEESTVVNVTIGNGVTKTHAQKQAPIGTPGFGVGIAPISIVEKLGLRPVDFVKTYDKTKSVYGNYINKDGDIIVWIPKMYFKWVEDNEVNKPSNFDRSLVYAKSPYSYNNDTFLKVSYTKDPGYWCHRAFINKDKEIRGIFVDKYPMRIEAHEDRQARLFHTKLRSVKGRTYTQEDLNKWYDSYYSFDKFGRNLKDELEQKDLMVRAPDIYRPSKGSTWVDIFTYRLLHDITTAVWIDSLLNPNDTNRPGYVWKDYHQRPQLIQFSGTIHNGIKKKLVNGINDRVNYNVDINNPVARAFTTGGNVDIQDNAMDGTGKFISHNGSSSGVFDLVGRNIVGLGLARFNRNNTDTIQPIYSLKTSVDRSTVTHDVLSNIANYDIIKITADTNYDYNKIYMLVSKKPYPGVNMLYSNSQDIHSPDYITNSLGISLTRDFDFIAPKESEGIDYSKHINTDVNDPVSEETPIYNIMPTYEFKPGRNDNDTIAYCTIQAEYIPSLDNEERPSLVNYKFGDFTDRNLCTSENWFSTDTEKRICIIVE